MRRETIVKSGVVKVPCDYATLLVVVFNMTLNCLLIYINVLRVESVTMMHKRAFYLRALFDNGFVFAISVPSN